MKPMQSAMSLQALELSKIAIAKRTPLDLSLVTRTGTFPFPKHLDYINKALMKVRERAIKRLIITVPPRHGKSETTSKAFPVNVLINNPKTRVMLATYAADFSAQWGRKARDLRSEEHTSELQSPCNLVCRLLLEKKTE